jgi:hypothetical protein
MLGRITPIESGHEGSERAMMELTSENQVFRFVRDMLVSLFAFILVAAVFAVSSNSAGAAETAAALEDGGRVLSFGLLAVVFSGLLAFNLTFFRHLRRAYAPKRPSVKGSAPKN